MSQTAHASEPEAHPDSPTLSHSLVRPAPSLGAAAQPPHRVEPEDDGCSTPDTGAGATHTSADRTTTKSATPRRGVWLVLAFLLAGGAAALMWRQSGSRPDQGLPEPAATGATVPVPAQRAEERAVATALEDPLEPQDTPSQAPLVQPATPGSLQATVDNLAAKFDNVLQSVETALTGLESQNQEIEALKTEMEQLKAQVARASAPSRPSGSPVRRAPVSRQPQAQTPPRADAAAAQLLSVDLWDGKPSVVVGRWSEAGNEVRFLQEGDAQGRVKVKEADVDGQRAVIATERGDVVMTSGQP